MAVRRSWPAYAKVLFVSLLLVAAPFFLMLPLFSWGRPGLAVFSASISLGAALAAFAAFRWRSTALLATDRRLIDVDQRGVFSRTVYDVPFSRVQDVSHERKGFWGAVLGYGTLTVRVRGADLAVEQRFVSRLPEVHRQLAAIVEENRFGPAGSGNERITALLRAAAELSPEEIGEFLSGLREADLLSGAAVSPKATEEEIESFLSDGFGTEGDGRD